MRVRTQSAVRIRTNEIANLALALDFSNPNDTAPSLPIVQTPPPHPCLGDGIMDGRYGGKTDSYYMINSPLVNGWPLPADLPA